MNTIEKYIKHIKRRKINVKLTKKKEVFMEMSSLVGKQGGRCG